MMADEGATSKAQYWVISEFPPHLTNKLWGELKDGEQAVELTLNMDGASQSSFWKDQRIKANNPFKTKEFAANWGTGAFTCTHTENDKAGAWWKATFAGGEAVTVTKIQILNRGDCCSKRLNNAVVLVGEHLCGIINDPKSGEWITLTCKAKGKFVKITVEPGKYLHFCGIRVWGYG